MLCLVMVKNNSGIRGYSSTQAFIKVAAKMAIIVPVSTHSAVCIWLVTYSHKIYTGKAENAIHNGKKWKLRGSFHK